MNNFEKCEGRLRSRLLPLLVYVISMFISVLIVSSHFTFLVSLMRSFRLVPASIVSSLKGSASNSSGVRPDMYQAHTRTRSLKDLYAIDDGKAREVMPLSRLVVKVSQLAFLKL